MWCPVPAEEGGGISVMMACAGEDSRLSGVEVAGWSCAAAEIAGYIRPLASDDW